MTDEQPAWEELPRHPERFFGLAPGFDRAQLKRGYNAMLRRFKPERFPEEFKRIRAAYEMLERRLSGSGRPVSQVSIPPDFTASKSVGSVPSNAFELGEQVERPEESLEEEYRRLESERTRTASQFTRLALLSDILGRPVRTDESSHAAPADESDHSNSAEQKSRFPPSDREIRSPPIDRDSRSAPVDRDSRSAPVDRDSRSAPADFHEWLLAGLQAHPKDLGLMRLYQLGAKSLARERVEPSLREAARLLHSSIFHQATAPLWSRLLDEAEFPRFAAVLEECEAKLPSQTPMRWGFDLYLLRRALWSADIDWCRARLAMLEERHRDLNPHQSHELDFLLMLAAYIPQREAFRHGAELTQRIDATMLSYCRDDPTTALQVFTECLAALRADATGLLAAIPVGASGSRGALDLFSWIERDFAARAFPPRPEVRTEWSTAVRSLNARISRQFKFSLFPLSMRLVGMGCTLGLLAVMFGPTILIGMVDGDPGSVRSYQAAMLILWTVILFRWMGKRLLLPWYRAITLPLKRRCYDKIARPELARFLLHAEIGVDRFQRELLAIQRRSRRVPIAAFLPQDSGIGFLGCTRRFIA